MKTTALFDLQGKTALLTGASKGKGKAMAVALAEQGARVMISSVNSTSAKPSRRKSMSTPAAGTCGVDNKGGAGNG